MKGESALGRQNMLKKNKNLQGSLDSGLLPEGHFLAPGIGRTVHFLDFSDFLFKNVFFLIYHFFEGTVLARTASLGSLLSDLPAKF